MRDSFVEEIAQESLRSVVEKGLDIKTQLSIGKKQKISIDAKPKIANLKIRPDKTCEHCIRISGTLTGKAGIKIPIFGDQTVPIAGDLSIVAPLSFEPTSEGQTAIKIDLQKAAQFNPNFLSLTLKQIPPTWSRVIANSFSKSAIQTVSSQLKPITVFTFDSPNFGIENLKVAAKEIKTDIKNRTIFVGFSTNLDAQKSGQGLQNRTHLANASNIGIGLDPRILASSASVLMHSGVLSNTYTEEGKSDPAGNVSITMDRFDVGEGKNNVIPVKIGFRYWKVPSDGNCLWADVEAESILSIQGQNLALEIKGFDVTKSSLPKIVVNLAKWTQSGFSATQDRVMTAPLKDLSIEIPGGKKIFLTPKRVNFEKGGIWLEADTSLK